MGHNGATRQRKAIRIKRYVTARLTIETDTPPSAVRSEETGDDCGGQHQQRGAFCLFGAYAGSNGGNTPPSRLEEQLEALRSSL